MSVGRISGPLLKANLLRDGVDLAFENDLLYLDVNNLRVGINTSSPTHDLTVDGTTRTTDLEVTNQANIGPFISISGTTISSTSPTLNLTPASNGVVYQNRLTVDDIDIENNVISTNSTNTDLEIRTQGTGQVRIFADTEINGNLHVTGNISADGNIQIGDVDTDSITFNADVASNIIPNVTDFYDIGSSTKRWNSIWTNNFIASNVLATNIIVDGVDIALEQGNILYVAANGSDSNAGRHQNDPLASVEYALSQAVAGDTVLIYPGVYQETLPLVVPAGVTVKGMNIRGVIIEPDTSSQTEDVFHLNGETTVEDLTVRGHYYDSLNNTGYAFRFAPGFAVTKRSPYIRNVTVLTFGSVMTTLDPRGFDQGDAGRGAYIDGAVADPSTIEASMLFHSVTFLCPGAETIVMTNGARVEWLNSFTYWADKGLYAFSGSSGIAGNGRTMVEVGGVTGVYNIGDTIEYYDDDGVTLLASGTIADIDNNKIFINGKSLGFVEFDERIGKLVVAYGDAQISNTTSQFGTTSLKLDGTGDYILSPSNQDYAYGTGDFTIEAWVYKTAAVQMVLVDQRTAATDVSVYLESSAAGNIRLFVNGAYRLTSSLAVPLNTWTHVAVSRDSGVTRLFVNGTVTPTTYADANDYQAKPFRVGTSYTGGTGWNGYVDEVRISKGIARYTTSFTVPTGELNNDQYTSLLLHFAGANGSTTITDESVLVQDIRFPVTGATATSFDQVDYTDFGAEVRSIGSACVYGNYGIYGDGDGVIMYLIGQNLAYIGLGKRFDNDPLAVVQANEVVELNRAKIYYTSVDHKGDFRVGDLFYVNQQTGTVEFTSALLNVIGTAGITLTSGADQTILSPTQVSTGNIKISGNTVESTSGDINIAAANNIINFLDDVNITGNLDVTGNVTIGGNITIGDQTTDSISFVGGIASNLVPKTGATYDVGLPNLQWKDLWVRTAHISDIDISTNVITTTVSNANLELRANGTGGILAESILINQNTISTSGGDNLIITPATTLDITATSTNITGSLYVSNDVNVDGNTTLGNNASDTTVFNARVNSNIVPTVPAVYDLGSPTNSWSNIYLAAANIDDIRIDTNVITTTVSNANLELRANGTGAVNVESLYINENVISSLGTDNIIISPATTLNITKDTNITGNLDVSGDITIGGNITIGDQPTDIINFNAAINSDLVPFLPVTYNLGSTAKRWKTVFTGEAQISDIFIDTNVIRTTVSNADLELRANGTGAIKLEDISVNQNVISVPTNTDIVIQPSGTGVFNVNSTQSMLLPKGTTAERPIAPKLTSGMVRYNTTNNNFEGYDGTYWRVLNGLYDVDQNTYLVAESAPGANDNTFYFYVNGSQVADLNSTRLRANRVDIDNIIIDNNTISTVSGTNLTLDAQGTGVVNIENFAFKNNTITNTVSGSITEISHTGTGYFKIGGTRGFVLPVGAAADRPGTPVTGFMRYNTDDQRVEVFDGTVWTSAAGSTSGVTVAQAEEIAIISALILG